MALQLGALQLLSTYTKGASVLSLSYPDILAPEEEIEKAFGYKPSVFSNHGDWFGKKYRLPETVEWFTHMGATLRCVDVARLRGCEDIVDLNYPADLGQYDLVINPGTLEHCFNFGVAMMSASAAVKPGGRIYHEAPVSMLNHGFYNLCPTLFYDFYTQNNWGIERFAIFSYDGSAVLTKQLATERKHIPREAHLAMVAVRLTDAPLKFPIQTKYLAMLGKAA